MTITINKPTLAEAKAAMVQAVAENNAIIGLRYCVSDPGIRWVIPSQK